MDEKTESQELADTLESWIDPPLRGNKGTRLDVAKLHAAFGIPEEDTLITYTQIAEVLGIPYMPTGRFRIVVDCWRKDLERDNSRYLDCLHTVGYKCMNASGRVVVTTKKREKGLRAFQRAIKIIVKTSRNALPTEDLRKTYDLEMSKLSNHLELERRQLSRKSAMLDAVVALNSSRTPKTS